MVKSNLYMEKYISTYPMASGIKNVEHIFVCANDEYAKEVGLQSGKQLVGLKSSEVPTSLSLCAHDFENEDNLVLQKGAVLYARFCVMKNPAASSGVS